jgi:hypothetical protein
MNPLGCSFSNSSARRIAPDIPSPPGVSTSCAPRAWRSFRRSTLIVSGIVRISRYPRAAQTKASAIPVLPLVGSMMVDSGPILPSASAASIMLLPMRSFTLDRGL